MGILTNFLKLLKPEENDYYNAITEQTENWQKVDDWAKGIDDSNKKKLDKGNVSVEYDTAKKIEDKIKEVQITADNKLNKGAYNGNAQDLKNEIDKKYNSSGGIITGIVTIEQKSIGDNAIHLRKNGELLGEIYTTNDGVVIKNQKSTSFYVMNNDGTVKIPSKDLSTNNKYVVGAINEIENNKWRFQSKRTPSLDFNNIKEPGRYTFGSWNNVEGMLNSPTGQKTLGCLIVCPLTDMGDNGYIKQIFINYLSEKIFVREFNQEVSPYWTQWKEVYTTGSVESWKSEDRKQGWVKYPDGRLEQWGVLTSISSNGQGVVTLPVAFSNLEYAVTSGQCAYQSNISYNDNQLQVYNKQQSSFGYYANDVGGVTGVMSYAWYAIGWWK